MLLETGLGIDVTEVGRNILQKAQVRSWLGQGHEVGIKSDIHTYIQLTNLMTV